MAINDSLKKTLKQALTRTLRLLDIPHNRPEDIVRAEVAALDKTGVDQTRIKLIAEATGRTFEMVQAFVDDYGRLIPDEYRPRWELRLEKETPILPQLLDEVGEIDFFYHDSLHKVDHMRWEYELAWPYLRKGGCLASHDILRTTAFDDFRKKYASEITFGGAIGNFGFVIKSD